MTISKRTRTFALAGATISLVALMGADVFAKELPKTCSIYVEDEPNSNNITAEIFSGPVISAPSYVIVMKGSTAQWDQKYGYSYKAFTKSEIDALEKNGGLAPYDGGLLFSFQPGGDPDEYAVYIIDIDSSKNDRHEMNSTLSDGKAPMFAAAMPSKIGKIAMACGNPNP